MIFYYLYIFNNNFNNELKEFMMYKVFEINNYIIFLFKRVDCINYLFLLFNR